MTGAERRDDGTWRLALRVEPGDGPPFTAHAELDWPGAGAPPVGGVVEVLHLGRGDRVLALDLPSRPDPPEPPPAPPGPAPDLAAVLRALVRAAGDGSLRQGTPIVLRDDPPGAPPG